jgi:hypothetical protein
VHHVHGRLIERLPAVLTVAAAGLRLDLAFDILGLALGAIAGVEVRTVVVVIVPVAVAVAVAVAVPVTAIVASVPVVSVPVAIVSVTMIAVVMAVAAIRLALVVVVVVISATISLLRGDLHGFFRFHWGGASCDTQSCQRNQSTTNDSNPPNPLHHHWSLTFQFAPIDPTQPQTLLDFDRTRNPRKKPTREKKRMGANSNTSHFQRSRANT